MTHLESEVLFFLQLSLDFPISLVRLGPYVVILLENLDILLSSNWYGLNIWPLGMSWLFHLKQRSEIILKWLSTTPKIEIDRNSTDLPTPTSFLSKDESLDLSYVDIYDDLMEKIQET